MVMILRNVILIEMIINNYCLKNLTKSMIVKMKIMVILMLRDWEGSQGVNNILWERCQNIYWLAAEAL
jgi:hypothetical protein